MTLYEQLCSDRLSARKESNTEVSSILTTLIGELQSESKRSGKDSSDKDVVRLCKKFMSNNNETMDYSTDKARINRLYVENGILNEYIPQQLTETQLYTVIADLDVKNIGQVMKHLNEYYEGEFDGKLASKIAAKKCKEGR